MQTREEITFARQDLAKRLQNAMAVFLPCLFILIMAGNVFALPTTQFGYAVAVYLVLVLLLTVYAALALLDAEGSICSGRYTAYAQQHFRVATAMLIISATFVTLASAMLLKTGADSAAYTLMAFFGLATVGAVLLKYVKSKEWHSFKLIGSFQVALLPALLIVAPDYMYTTLAITGLALVVTYTHWILGALVAKAMVEVKPSIDMLFA